MGYFIKYPHNHQNNHPTDVQWWSSQKKHQAKKINVTKLNKTKQKTTETVKCK